MLHNVPGGLKIMLQMFDRVFWQNEMQREDLKCPIMWQKKVQPFLSYGFLKLEFNFQNERKGIKNRLLK